MRKEIALLLGAPVLFFSASAVLSETGVQRTLKLPAGGELSVEVEVGAVTVRGASEPDARVVVTSRRGDLDRFLTISFEEKPGLVRVIGRRKHRLSWFDFRGESVQFDVQVPAETRVRVHTSGGGIKLSGTRSPAHLETSGGGIEVRDLSGELDAHTSGGSIRLTQIRGRARVDTSGGGIYGTDLSGPIRAETSGGRVELTRVAGDIDAHSSGGGIRIEAAGGRVDADTSGGGIDASFLPGNARGGRLESSGGSVAVSLDPAVDLEIDASGSSVRTDLPIRVRGEISRGSLHGTLGRGGAMLRVHTSGGGVRITPL